MKSVRKHGHVSMLNIQEFAVLFYLYTYQYNFQ